MLILIIQWWITAQMAREQPQPKAPPQTQVTFANDVQPILKRRCTPCHFPGGVMHAKLPFDQQETIYKLNTQLFTRIKAEDEQKVIRAFLTSPRAASPAAEVRPVPGAPRPAKVMTSGAVRARRE